MLPVRQGLIKIGDRLLTINYIDVTRYSVSAAMALLKKCKSEVTLDVQYDVTIQGMCIIEEYTY